MHWLTPGRRRHPFTFNLNYLLWHKAFKNSRYTEGYACEFLKTFYQQHLSTPHPQKSLNSGLTIEGKFSFLLIFIYHSNNISQMVYFVNHKCLPL
jgi:hypothetical protein